MINEGREESKADDIYDDSWNDARCYSPLYSRKSVDGWIRFFKNLALIIASAAFLLGWTMGLESKAVLRLFFKFIVFSFDMLLLIDNQFKICFSFLVLLCLNIKLLFLVNEKLGDYLIMFNQFLVLEMKLEHSFCFFEK